MFINNPEQKVVLLADNDKDFLSLLGEYLTDAGYAVIYAESVESARAALDHRRLHVAILDIRLTDDDNPEDISGIQLAQESAYADIPKIILTNHPTYQTAVKALGSPGGKPGAVDYLTKNVKEISELINSLTDALETLFQKNLPINWKLGIEWEDSLPITISGLASLLYGEEYYLPERALELQDLLRKFFTNYDQITIDRLLWRDNQRAALEVFAHSSRTTERFIIICGTVQAARDERDKIRKYHSTNTGELQIQYQEVSHFGLNAIPISSQATDYLTALPEYFKSRREARVIAGIEMLLRHTLGEWHSKGAEIMEETSLADFYRKFYGFNQIQDIQDQLERIFSGLVKECIAQQICDLTIESGLWKFNLPGVKNPLELDDASPWLWEGELVPARRVHFFNSPGSLRPNTILLDGEGNAQLTNFIDARQLPAMHDYVFLENAIRFDILEPGELIYAYNMEKNLLSARTLGDMVNDDDVETSLRRGFTCIQTIRKTAAENHVGDLSAYYTGLFFNTAADLFEYDPLRHHPPQKISGIIYRMILMAMLVKACKNNTEQDGKDTFTANAYDILQINLKTRDVRVGERRVSLSPTEYELLLFMYEQAGGICTRAEIMKNVFKIEKPTPDDEHRLDVNISRIREAIEPNAAKPLYLHTRRGQGFILTCEPS